MLRRVLNCSGARRDDGGQPNRGATRGGCGGFDLGSSAGERQPGALKYALFVWDACRCSYFGAKCSASSVRRHRARVYVSAPRRVPRCSVRTEIRSDEERAGGESGDDDRRQLPRPGGGSDRGLLPTPFAQVQPRPSDISELLRLVKDLRRHELPLKTELLEHKLVRET
ncbi:hypothetical protein NL676_028932 [Syzygium grande]|nr:hypothetical protein NL676_028932 [Syzygium grande]